MSLNKLELIGIFGQDPETKAAGETTVTSFSLATHESYKGEKTTTWHRCKMFGKTGEVVSKYHKKGDMIYLEGKMKYGSYENKDGVTVYTAEAIMYSFKFLNNKPKKESQTEERKQSTEEDNNAPF